MRVNKEGVVMSLVWDPGQPLIFPLSTSNSESQYLINEDFAIVAALATQVGRVMECPMAISSLPAKT